MKIKDRYSLSKERGYSGVGIYRQPDVPIYKINLEREFEGCEAKTVIYKDTEIIKVAKDFADFFLSYFDNEFGFFDAISAGSINCLPKSDLFLSIFNTYKRKFVTTPSMSKNAKPNYSLVCPKLDGIRGIGLWDRDTLVVYSLKCGFKSFTGLPNIWSPTVIVQVELYPESDEFVVTEIYACMHIDNTTDHVNWMRDNKHVQIGEGLYNGSNTTLQLQSSRRQLFIDVNPKNSIDIIQLLNTRYPLMFTKYTILKSEHYALNLSNIIKIACRGFESFPVDGALLLILTRDFQYRWSSEYIKLKTAHTIELLFQYKTTNFVSMNGHVYNSMIDTRGMTNDEREQYVWQQNHCKQAGRNAVFEFTIVRDLKNTYFRPKCIREDKIEPDGDYKIKQLSSRL